MIGKLGLVLASTTLLTSAVYEGLTGYKSVKTIVVDKSAIRPDKPIKNGFVWDLYEDRLSDKK